LINRVLFINLSTLKTSGKEPASLHVGRWRFATTT
jgi:hypothetical protein